MNPIDRLLAKLPEAKQSGKKWLSRCPAHDDNNPSLSIAEGSDGRALVHCFAGCNVEAICTAVGLSVRDLMPTSESQPEPRSCSNGKKGKGTGGKIVATYDYRDEKGDILFQVVRYEPKDFRRRRRKPGGGWIWNLDGVRVVPYRLPWFLNSPKKAVFICEGEKDADNLAQLGLLATCNSGGAKKWTAEHAEFLRGRHAVIIPDNDDPGRDHAQKVAITLHAVGATIKILELPGVPPKGDVSDWLNNGGTKEKLISLSAATPLLEPTAATPLLEPTAATRQPWPEIVPFDKSELPEFPTECLPSVLRDWVEAESHATQTPGDLAGLLALAVCSATIARRVVVEPRPGWREPVNLFVAVLLEPGNRKSTVFNDAIDPLRGIETALIKMAQPAVAREQSERRQAEARLQKLEKTAATKGDANARREACDLAAELAERPVVCSPRLIVDDATSEKLGMMLAAQGGRIASMSPEGGVFDLMAGLYSKSGIPQFGVYLMGHSGDDLITDRVSRQTVRVERPALTCAYAMQPAVIDGLAENTAFRGRGLLARFLYSAPESWIGHREIATEPVSDAIRDAYHQIVRAMADVEGEHVLLLSPDASAAFIEWEREVETMLGDGGEMEVLRDWGAKLAGATLRLAAVLHCVEHSPDTYMDESAIAAAIEIARYLIPHAETVLTLMQSKEKPGDEDAQFLLRWIIRRGQQEFTKRDAHQHGKRRFPKANDIDPALNELVRRGNIRLRPGEAAGPGRPPSPTYEVNPAVFKKDIAENCRPSSMNVDNESKVENSENNESASQGSENAPRVEVTI